MKFSRRCKRDLWQPSYDTENESVRFKLISEEVPSGIPHPDGVSRVERAGRSYRGAMRELLIVQADMAKFLLHDIVPEGLEPDAVK